MSYSKTFSLIRRLGPDEAGVCCDQLRVMTYNEYLPLCNFIPRLEILGINQDIIDNLRQQKEK